MTNISNNFNNKIFNDINTGSYEQSAQRHRLFYTSSIKPEDSFNKKKKDASNDGKFSIDEAVKNFVVGIINPVKSVFADTKTVLMTAGMIGAGAALSVATSGAVLPLFITAGVITGGYQVLHGIHNLITAKDGDDAERAFLDFGEATFILGSTVLGAKASLNGAKASGIRGIENVDDMSRFQAVIQNIKLTGKSAKMTAEKFTSGRAFNDLKNVFSGYEIIKTKTNKKAPEKVSQAKLAELEKYSTEIYVDGVQKYDDAFNEFKSILPDNVKLDLKGRYKGLTSIRDKLIKKTLKGENIDNISIAKENIGDLIGTRVILKDSSSTQIDDIVNSLVKGIKSGKLNIIKVENYRGVNCDPYFSNAHIEKVQIAAFEAGKDIEILSSVNILKPSGYTTTQLNIIHNNGLRGEFQIKGKIVNQLAECEHIAYDLRESKNLSKGINQLGRLFDFAKRTSSSMNEEQINLYKQYINKMYQHARKLEQGKPSIEPIFPKELNKALSIENLDLLNYRANMIKKDPNIIAKATSIGVV
ncbi:MAG: hypothetical protein PHV68_04390, partial [Candidatus Gastranaerophilales bacterium]|nr:hypothetical protein [Candidatus Gastranaerophilales bacterium]